MSGPCIYCGGVNYAPSIGGPLICPSCDCGNFGPNVVQRQGETITALRSELAAVKDILLNPNPDDEPDVIRLHREKCDMFDRALAAESEVARLKAERLKLDKRIHCQRKALRENWEIVEMRRKWLGSETARRRYADLWKKYRALRGW
jgi:hypothetical protein